MSEKIVLNVPLSNSHDIDLILEISSHLQLFADLTQSDVFIDCLLPGEDTVAIVVAEAHPTTSKSMYKRPVIGQLALKENEPGVFFSIESGRPVMGSRGISQEKVSIQQNVIPIKNREHQTIGALIMEQDITERIKQEKHVEVLLETTEQLSETIFRGAMSENNIPALIHEGLLLFNHDGMITFANERAHHILRDFNTPENLVGTNIEHLCFGKFSMIKMNENGGLVQEEFQKGKFVIQLKAVCIHRDSQTVGGILLLRDLSEIKEKEKQLMIKSAVIKEIHHRVKNNLQTIASLLRLQMRRSNSSEVEKVFRESINRIMSIAMIHEVLSQDGLDAIDCTEIFDYVSRGIVSSMKRKDQSIQVEIKGDPVYLSSKKASSLALIMNELVQNSMNHAFKYRKEGVIQIQVKQMNEFVTIAVIDNGVGFTFDDRRGGNLGLEICQTLVNEDLSGYIDFTNTGTGTKVSITFPIPKEGMENEA
ncbi:sensor histidine kinase [Ferdinandcohnia quinoae]|uniref:histidine kinase n=1 Tax=Fredinandcohnia quinoae TaxID=2918902 RepID=A0AAW5DTP6_9BACI|nr:sensor histidine kinase [Fredinandcohnia sp. SECRCQ15]MCH1624016.1 sensor histidine kinase [Fredinandcohnia sp. SECRCQ15]